MLEGTSRGTATDDNGRYVLRGVPAGVYTVRISFLGYRDETLEVTVESGMTVTRDVSLESETIEVGELTGQLQDVLQDTLIYREFNELQREKGYKKYIIPDDVGGRFSVLTPVGLLPIAAAGVDIRSLFYGAVDACERYGGRADDYVDRVVSGMDGCSWTPGRSRPIGTRSWSGPWPPTPAPSTATRRSRPTSSGGSSTTRCSSA